MERNYLTDVGKLSVHVHKEINAEKYNDKVTESEEVNMIIASIETDKREAQLAIMEKHKKVHSSYYNGCDANIRI